MEGFINKLWSLMGAFALLQTFLPPPLRQYLDRWPAMLWEKLFQTADPHVDVQVEEKMAGSHTLNVFYREATVYLSSLPSAIDRHARLKACRSVENGNLSFRLPDNEALEDTFEGASIWWTHTSQEKGGDNEGGCERGFTLLFLKSHRSTILPAYLDHVSKIAAEIERKNSQRYLFTNNYGSWEGTPFNHPSTFDTLALDAGLADRIKSDLDVFSEGESYYHRNGRAWKRGYLLYGPPGTGKSSMIAAISNYLEYDIYDLELTKVSNNADLKSLLMQTTRKSVVIIEDIDCSVQLGDRTATKGSDGYGADTLGDSSSKLTLSGLLNFTDGLWSCCGEERIFIFTTNHKDRLDAALLRPGRMDMHILLSYCTFPALKKLASNYLEIQDHPMYPKLEDVMARAPHKITPADMAEMLISNQSDPDAAFRQIMAALPRDTSARVAASAIDKIGSELLPESPKKVRSRGRALFFLAAVKGKHID